MKVYNLCCEHEHRFEGWFASEQDFDKQMTQDLILCPVCQSSSIQKLLSAPRINVSTTEIASSTNSKNNNNIEQQQKKWLTLMRRIVEQTEDVGTQFAEEARRIHYQETPARGIRGTATVHECEALSEEGINVASLPLPEVLKHSLQ